MSVDDLPYVQAIGDGGPRRTTRVVVIHATDNTASDEAETAYASHRPDKTSAHFYNDGDSVIRALPIGDIAFGCLPHGNSISVQFELCGLSDHLPDTVMRRVAPVVAEVCRRYNLPIAKLTAEQVAAGARGICGHAEITKAFPEDGGTHTDPGPHFPWDTFIRYVAEAAGQNPPPPPPLVVFDPPWPGRYLKQPPMMAGEDVRTWQARMSVRGWRVVVDGWYGPASAQLCRAFQLEKHLVSDGVVGPVTWRAAFELPIT